MFYLGRIITNSKTVDTLDYVEKTNSVAKIDYETPTLIVGKDLAISIFGKENIKVRNKEIKKGIFWTYTKLEKRSEYEKDILKFNKLILSKINETVNYVFFDIINAPYSRIKKFLNFIDSKELKTIFISHGVIYIYYNKNVFGISLDNLEYIGINREKIINRLKANPLNFIIFNQKFLSETSKRIINGNRILVPYLYFLEKQ